MKCRDEKRDGVRQTEGLPLRLLGQPMAPES